MKPEAQRIAIAEACGWRRRFDELNRQWIAYRPDGSVAYCDPDPNAEWEAHVLHDYLNDLNAMHEAEKRLTAEQRTLYTYKIECVLNLGLKGIIFDIAHATAAQRAEAFLRTIGKWEEGE